MKKIIPILGILGAFLLGVLTMTGAEVIWGGDDTSPYFMFERILPQQMINTMIAHPAIINYLVNETEGTTQIWYDQKC